jgi:pimeloyl-ACP methyl ester carboxylesterase
MPTQMNPETTFSLLAGDGKEIHGVMHSPSQVPTVAVILVHGLTGQMTQYLHIMLGKLLSRAGFAVFRFDQYGDEESQRRFHTSTIRLHVSDTKTAIEHVRSLGFKKIVLAGHSLGSPIAIEATDPGIAGLMLLDPTGDPKDRIKDWEVRDSQRELSFLDWRVRIMLGEEWIEDAKTFPDPYKRFSQVTCPSYIIAAECAEQMKYCVRYREARPTLPEILVVPGATHCFTEEGAVEALGRAMEQWIVGSVA